MCSLQLYLYLQAACTLLLLAFVSHVGAVGEVGQAPNECYETMPTDLPITVSYSKSSTPSITTFTFLVRLINLSATDGVMCSIFWWHCLLLRDSYSILCDICGLLQDASTKSAAMPLQIVNINSRWLAAAVCCLCKISAISLQREISLPAGQCALTHSNCFRHSVE